MEALGLPTSTAWLVVALVLGAIAAVMMFVPRLPAPMAAYAAMWSAQLSGFMLFSRGTLIFWGIAVVLVVANHYMLPGYIRNSGRGVAYVAAGALAGMAVGLTMYRPATIIGGAVAGALVGGVAYARTSRGKVLEFPTVKFFNYLGAKGIPAVMVASMIGLIIAGLILYRI